MDIKEIIEKGIENLTEIKTKQELNEIKLNYRYYTYNYSLLKRMKGNRGGNEKIDRIVKKIDAGSFDYDFAKIVIDKNGITCEGNCTTFALKERKMPIVFNVGRTKTLEEVAEFNDGTTKAWRPKEHFDAVIEIENPAALKLDEIRDKVNTDYNLSKIRGLSSGQLMSCVTENFKYLNGGKNAPRIQDFTDNLLNKINDEAIHRIKQVARMKRIMYFCGYESPHHVIKYILPLHFDKNIDFDIEVFVDAIEKERFTFDEPKKKSIQKEALKVYYKHVKENSLKGVVKTKKRKTKNEFKPYRELTSV